MNLTGCVPLPGRGLVARYGGLVALTDATEAGPDPLLGTLAEIANAGADGTALALAVTRVALERGGRPAWACAGVTAGGEVTVLVHGDAVALVSVEGGQEAEVTDSGSMIPVVRSFAGAFATIRLILGSALTSPSGLTAPDPRSWLGSGVVSGAGILLAVAHEAGHGQLPDSAPAPLTAGPPAGYEQTMLAGVNSLPEGAPATQNDAVSPNGAGRPNGAGNLNGAGSPNGTPGAQPGSGPDPYTESWFSEPQPATPTMRMTRTDPGSPSGALNGEAPIADLAAVELVRLGPVEPVLVDGLVCERMHFNPPDARACRECGLPLPSGGPQQNGQSLRRQPRPPLGLLLVDDGRGYVLDRDFVIGREPLLDGDVAAGRATPLPISDPEGSVSRLHLRISLVGWQVEAHDLGSSNGSVLYRADGPRTLAPLDAVALDPGARVGVGRRTVQFLPYSAFPSSAFPPSGPQHGAPPRRAPNGAI